MNIQDMTPRARLLFRGWQQRQPRSVTRRALTVQVGMWRGELIARMTRRLREER